MSSHKRKKSDVLEHVIPHKKRVRVEVSDYPASYIARDAEREAKRAEKKRKKHKKRAKDVDGSNNLSNIEALHSVNDKQHHIGKRKKHRCRVEHHKSSSSKHRYSEDTADNTHQIKHKHRRQRVDSGESERSKKKRKKKAPKVDALVEINDQGDLQDVRKLKERRRKLDNQTKVSDFGKSRVKDHKSLSQSQNTRQHDEVTGLLHATWSRKSDQIKELREKGFKIKKGRWTSAEVDTLKANMESYLKANNIPDPESIIFRGDTTTEESRHWKELSQYTDFYRHLGKGIRRPLFSVYRRVLRMYNKGNYLGRYTEEEVQELKRLLAVHGKKWSLIGRLMGRSDLSVNHKFISLQGERGAWSEEELNCLKNAVRILSKTEQGSPLYYNVEWLAVAEMVKTRSPEQCRRKWLDSVCWKECQDGKRWGPADTLKLITRVYNSGVTEESDVDWSELMDVNWKNARSPQWLRMKWSIVKKNVPNYQDAEFEELVDYLYHVYGQTLRDKLGEVL